MSRDIYSSLSGATAAQYQMDLIAQNVANANTNGYKELRVAFELDGSGFGPLGQVQTRESETRSDMRSGSIRVDKDPNHLALQGEGFFGLREWPGAVSPEQALFSATKKAS